MVFAPRILESQEFVVSILLLARIPEGLESLANVRLALTPIFNVPRSCAHQYSHNALPVGYISAEQWFAVQSTRVFTLPISSNSSSNLTLNVA
jgi:hypothetical protein